MAKNIEVRDLFNDYTLTAAYVVQNATPWIEIKNVDQVTIDVEYTGASTVEFIVEFANLRGAAFKPLATTPWVRQVAESTTAGVTTLTAQEYTCGEAAFQIAFPVSSQFMRVSAKGTGSINAKVILSSQETNN